MWNKRQVTVFVATKSVNRKILLAAPVQEWTGGRIKTCLQLGRGVVGPGLAQDVLKLDQKIDVQPHGDDQDNQPDDGKGADAAAHGAQVFD